VTEGTAMAPQNGPNKFGVLVLQLVACFTLCLMAVRSSE